MPGANAGNMQNRTPQQQQQQQQQNMMGPNRTQQPQNMMGPNRNQQQMGANTTMNNNMNMQQQQPNMMNQGGPQQQTQNMMNQNNMRGNMNPNMQQPQQQPPITTSQSTGLFSSSLFSGPSQAAGSMFGGNRGPQVVPGQMGMNQQQQQQGQMGMNQQQQQQGQQPGGGMLGMLGGKLGDMASAAPGGDMLSKGKELIFMKFGLGGK